MVNQMGMSDVIGPRLVEEGVNFDGYELKEKADDEVDRIISEQYQRGLDLLSNNRDVLDSIAKLLLDKEKITGDEFISEIRKVKPELVL